MFRNVCDQSRCTGCHACADICPRGAITIVDNTDTLEAVIDAARCIKCDMCYTICPNHAPVPQLRPIEWYQGWSNSETEREKSSSGGFATEVARAFIRHGGAVCGCVFQNGQFVFKVIDTEEDVEQFRGSKYVKSNPHGIYKEIKNKIQDGKEVLFIGLPCQVAAVKNYLGAKYQEKLATVDLICHGTPSTKLFKFCLEQQGYELSLVRSILFRKKNNFGLQINGSKIVHPYIQDSYILSFLKSLIYTDNCYSCLYAKQSRVSDITLGDSWGSSLPEKEIEKGISLALCQTKKGINLLKQSNVHLEYVDIDIALKSNHQLCHPAQIPAGRELFFKRIKRGMKFEFAVALAYPSYYFKRLIKLMLLKFFPSW